MSLESVKRIIAVHSAKGGVGKSTVAVNLAVGLAQAGAKTGLLDADIHGPSSTLMLGTDEEPELGPRENTVFPVSAHGLKFISIGNLTDNETPLIWRGAMVHQALSQFINQVIWGELDYLVIDLPPGTGDAQISLAQMLSIDGVIVVTTPQELSLADTIRGIRAFDQFQIPLLGIVENMSFFICDGCEDRVDLFGASRTEIIAEELGLPLLARVPLESVVCESGDDGRPVLLSHPTSSSAHVFETLVRRVTVALEMQKPTVSFKLDWQKMSWDERYPEPPEKFEDSEGLAVKAIWQVSADELGLQWHDGEIHTLSVRRLRETCPCAVCIDEWTGEAKLDPATLPGDLSLKLIQPVGRYAIQPVFTDGHSSGIFHFKRLRQLVKPEASAHE